MTPGTHGSRPLEVWMDGGCSLCRRSRTWCEARDTSESMVFLDFRGADDADLPLDREAHQKSMWVRADDGTLHEGFAAWRLIMQEIPGWRWLATLTGQPPFSWFGPPIYRLVARFRRHLP